MIELLTTMEADFARLGEPDIRRAQRSLSKIQPGEKALGVIHNEALKKMWVLASHYEGVAKRAAIDVEHKAETEEESQELKQCLCRFTALEDIARNLFWSQAKDDIGAWGRSGSIALREDWMLVSFTTESPSLAAILGSIVRPWDKEP